jgi:hypothetical protein
LATFRARNDRASWVIHNHRDAPFSHLHSHITLPTPALKVTLCDDASTICPPPKDRVVFVGDVFLRQGFAFCPSTSQPPAELIQEERGNDSPLKEPQPKWARHGPSETNQHTEDQSPSSNCRGANNGPQPPKSNENDGGDNGCDDPIPDFHNNV